MRRYTARRPAGLLVLMFVVVFAGLMWAQAQPPAAQQRPPQQQTGPPFPRVPPLPFPDGPQVFETLGPQIRVVPFAKGLVNPWSLTFLPDGNMLVTEKAGQLRIVRNGTLDPKPITGVPAVWTTGQGGLMEVALHPRFAENRFVYLTYSKPGEGGAASTALARGRLDGTALTDVRDLFVGNNLGTGRPHFGSKLAFAADGTLFMTTGERGERDKAQDLSLHNGKILHLRDDGTVPPDNPFVGKSGARPEIYSYGHRNVQGLVFDANGTLWAHEHGPQGGDELNRIQPGKNYGWPVATFGREYTGEFISNASREGIEPPVMFWAPSIGISGLAAYNGDRFPSWKGNFFVGGLSGLHIQRVAFNDRGPVGREYLIGSLKQRVRDVRQGPDGLLYVAVDGEPAGLLRIEPASSQTSEAAGR